MDIEFDPAKDAINIAKHGVSLARAAEMDLNAAAVVLDTRQNYGEVRYRAFGTIAGLNYCLAFTPRAHAVRVISLRRAHQEEMDFYL